MIISEFHYIKIAKLQKIKIVKITKIQNIKKFYKLLIIDYNFQFHILIL